MPLKMRIGARSLGGNLLAFVLRVAAVMALLGAAGALAGGSGPRRQPLLKAARVLDPEAGDHAAEDHQAAGKPDPEVEAVLGGGRDRGADRVRLLACETARVGHRERLVLGLVDD